MDDPTLRAFTYALLAFIAAYSIESWLFRSKIAGVPLVGSPGVISSYRDAFRFLLHGEEIVHKGYQRYNGVVFRVPFLGRWNFVASGPALKHIYYTPEDVLSFDEAIRDMMFNIQQLQADITLGSELRETPYHIPAVLTSLTRNLGKRFPDVRNEVDCAFEDILELQGTEWKLIPLMSSITDIVARISNRLFVGLPLCRDPEYLKFSVKHTVDVVIAAQLINLLPSFLRPSGNYQGRVSLMRLMGPLVAARIAMFEEQSKDWPDKPVSSLLLSIECMRLKPGTQSDLVTWLLDMAEPPQRTVPAIIQRVLVVVMAAIHTSSLTFAEALLDLATYPSYMEPLRREVESVIQKHGWTKAALGEMHKVDSLLRESQRINGLGCLALFRKVIHSDGFKFSDGTFLPSGSFINVPTREIHHDAEKFTNPDVFDGFRFYNMRSSPSEGSVFKHYMVTTEPTHLPFGHGKHACPGRFFAATELKSMLAHIVINYDVKLEHDGERPPDQLFNTVRMPNSKAKIWFRKRQL
ncbi:cytochrome P450 [Mycena galericulata]|nr:cytochrome P450 [Mycena galericulata]